MPIYNETNIQGITPQFIQRQKYNYWKSDPLFKSLYEHLLHEKDEEIYQDKLEEILIFISDIKTLHEIGEANES